MNKKLLILGLAILAFAVSIVADMPNYDTQESLRLIYLNKENDPYYPKNKEQLQFTVPPGWTIDKLSTKIEWLERLLQNPSLIETEAYRDSTLPVPYNIGIFHEPMPRIPLDKKDIFKIENCKSEITIEKAVRIWTRQYNEMEEEGFRFTDNYIKKYFDEKLYFNPPQIPERVYRRMAPAMRERYDYLRSLSEPPSNTLYRRNGTKDAMDFSGWWNYWDGYSSNDWNYNYNWNTTDGWDWYYFVPGVGDLVIIDDYPSYYQECRVTSANTARVLQVMVYDYDLLVIEDGYWLYIGNSGDENWEFILYMDVGSEIELNSGGIQINNYNTSTGVSSTGSANCGHCFTVDGTFDINGGTAYIDDDIIIHGTVDQDGGTIYTGYDSNDGACWVSGSSGLSARYYMSGSSYLYVERYLFTSGYNASPWNYGLGTGRFQASGGNVYLTNGGAGTGVVYVYDGGSSHSYFNNVYLRGTTEVRTTYGNYMYINGYLRPDGNSLYPISRIRFARSREGIDGDEVDLSNVDHREDDPTSIESDQMAEISFDVRVKQNLNKVYFSISSPVSVNGDIEIYDILGKKVYHRNTGLNFGMNEIDIDIQYFNTGTYLYKINAGQHNLTGKFVKIR